MNKLRGLENTMKNINKNRWKNFMFRSLYLFSYTYISLKLQTHDPGLGLIITVCFLAFGYLFMFLGFYFIDYFFLKKADFSKTYALLSSILFSGIFYLITNDYFTSLRNKMLSIAIYAFFPSIISYTIFPFINKKQ